MLKWERLSRLLKRQYRMLGPAHVAVKIRTKVVTPGVNPGEPPAETLTDHTLTIPVIIRDIPLEEIEAGTDLKRGDGRLRIHHQALDDAGITASDLNDSNTKVLYGIDGSPPVARELAFTWMAVPEYIINGKALIYEFTISGLFNE